MKLKRENRKKRPASGETSLVTRALTHIRLVGVNSGKLAALDALAPVYLDLCQQYVTLFCTVEHPNKLRAPCYPTALSERWHRVAIMQAAGSARAWRSNHARALQEHQEAVAIYQETMGLDVQPPEQETEGKASRAPEFREWNVPTLREWCLLLTTT